MDEYEEQFWEDDFYQYNQNEADDYRNELDEDEIDEKEDEIDEQD